MITDRIAAIVEEQWPPFADAIGLDFEVSVLVQPTGQPGAFALFALFVFAADSPVLGQRLWHVAPPIALDDALNALAVQRLLLDVTNQLADVRQQILAQGNGAHP